MIRLLQPQAVLRAPSRKHPRDGQHDDTGNVNVQEFQPGDEVSERWAVAQWAGQTVSFGGEISIPKNSLLAPFLHQYSFKNAQKRVLGRKPNRAELLRQSGLS